MDAEERAKQRDLARGDGIGLVEEVFTELGARRMTVQEGWALWGQDLPQGRYNVGCFVLFSLVDWWLDSPSFNPIGVC